MLKELLLWMSYFSKSNLSSATSSVVQFPYEWLLRLEYTTMTFQIRTDF